jgi:hypothetical protein
MHWTGTGMAVGRTEAGEPLSAVRPWPTARRRSFAQFRRASSRLSPARTPALPPVMTAPTRGQVLMVAALISLTSLATAVVMAQGIGYLDTRPGPGTTPYLSDAPQGPVHAPSTGPTGSQESSVAGETLNGRGPGRGPGTPPRVEQPDGAVPDRVVPERSPHGGARSDSRPGTVAASPGNTSSPAGGTRGGGAANGSVLSDSGPRPKPAPTQSLSRRARSASTHSSTSSSSSGSTPSATIRARMSLTGSPNASPVIRSV